MSVKWTYRLYWCHFTIGINKGDVIVRKLRRDKIYKDLEFSTEFSVEDWNALIKLKLGKYFTDDSVFEENKEILRTEIINYIKFCTKEEYFKLFEWTFDISKDCILLNRQKSIKILADSFEDISNTDMKWMTNVLIQPDSSDFSERDKISYYFKAIDETLEGAFKPRFKLLDKLINFKLSQIIVDNSSFDFGKLIREFPSQVKCDVSLFLKDPLFSIPTNQWRNIAAHKSFTINTDNIVVAYGKGNIHTKTISYCDFYKIVNWTQDIYRVIRLAQVLTDLNYIAEIVEILGGTENMNVRFEASLLHIIHNMQIVGFEFVSNEKQNGIFCLNVKGKVNHDVKSSLIHASQCLDQLSCAIYDDKFVRDNFQKTKVSIVNDSGDILASATISVEAALKRAQGKLTLNEYLSKIEFDVKN
ncbi:hypothetical protein HMPREF9714_02849 [Myroides odoratimimus CCUG 12901]|uniref:hypothetical protein n=1 Tax=Myroides odoratimimus TaxID=76832 RepID=UPI000246171F|nr:hypothetical protein [Myroides odoratimimus]EHO06998.1 hypothetical protein HMPREF9714_02849 [Myroides odoratimimus CCUG 12901]